MSADLLRIMFTTVSRAVVLLVASFAFGSPVAGLAADITSVSFRAVYFDPRETETPKFYVLRGGSTEPVELDKSRLSSPQKAAVRDGRFVDFQTTPNPKPGEGDKITAALPDGTPGDLLFIFAPSGKGHGVKAVLLPTKDFKAGDTLAFNTTPIEVAVRIGSAGPVILNRTSNQIVPIPDGFKDSMIPVQIFERSAATSPWTIIQSTRWPVDKRFRSYLFFYRLQDSGPLQIHGITERLEP